MNTPDTPPPALPQHFNLDFAIPLAIDTRRLDWLPSPAAGVRRKPLEREQAESGHTTSLVEYAPGTAFASHLHPRGEEIFVLEGVFSDESGDFPAGSYLRNPPGSRHAPFSREGCVIFVKLNQFAPDDLQPVRLSAESGYWQVLDDGRQQRLLHRFGRTCTTLERWPAGLSVPAHPAGEQRLLLAGELSDGDTHHPSGSWLRTPRGDQRTWHALTDSLLLVKTGHLPGAPR